MFQTSPPGLRDFYNDMNKHGMAEYRKSGENIVAELDTCPGGWAVTLWEAVEEEDHYAPPDGKEGNRYAWDAIGRETYEDYDEAKRVYHGLGTEASARSFCEANPYDGPRRPYTERVSPEQ